MSLIKYNSPMIYTIIPTEYVCVYHKILEMLCDFGIDMLNDCKASCNDKNKDVIDCFNMFNAAVAANKLEKYKLAETIIKYIKAKVNQIYQNKGYGKGFVFPIDELGKLRSFVTCDSSPVVEVDSDAYAEKQGSGSITYDFPIGTTVININSDNKYVDVDGNIHDNIVFGMNAYKYVNGVPFDDFKAIVLCTITYSDESTAQETFNITSGTEYEFETDYIVNSKSVVNIQFKFADSVLPDVYISTALLQVIKSEVIQEQSVIELINSLDGSVIDVNGEDVELDVKGAAIAIIDDGDSLPEDAELNDIVLVNGATYSALRKTQESWEEITSTTGDSYYILKDDNDADLYVFVNDTWINVLDNE